MSDCSHEKTASFYYTGYVGETGYAGEVCDACGERIHPFQAAVRRQAKERQQKDEEDWPEVIGK